MNVDLQRNTVTHVKHGQYFIREGAVYSRVDFIKGHKYECFNQATKQYVYLGANSTVYILPEWYSLRDRVKAL